jgi:hypothetical protein
LAFTVARCHGATCFVEVVLSGSTLVVYFDTLSDFMHLKREMVCAVGGMQLARQLYHTRPVRSLHLYAPMVQYGGEEEASEHSS